ncbi:MAG: STAS domain-containing protein [Christensenellaceae bacterium]|nr:STAS domain-containing protein [Christensenellaceae bacterium]
MKFELRGNALYIKLPEELDHVSAIPLRKRVDKLLSLGGYESVVFDLTHTTFIDSTGIGFILGRYKLLQSLNKQLYIMPPDDKTDKVLKLCGIYTIISKLNEVI